MLRPLTLVNMLELCLLSFRIATKSRKEGGEAEGLHGQLFQN